MDKLESQQRQQQRLAHAEHGATMVEYAIVVGFVTFVVIVAVGLLGLATLTLFPAGL